MKGASSAWNSVGIIGALLLAACSWTVTLTAKPTGTIAHGIIPFSLGLPNKIIVTLDDKKYEGRFKPETLDQLDHQHGRGYNHLYGAVVELRAADESSLYCSFTYRAERGAGTCQSSEGRQFDLKISPPLDWRPAPKSAT